jgi:CheY-like chemotaxis protein
LLDVLLPRKSGLDVLRAGIIQDRGIPVIGISGVATDAEIRTSLQLGATDFLQKPIPLDLMREVLDYARVLNEPLTKGVDRRRSPRPTLAIPVRIVESGLLQWQTTSVDLSVFGLRVQGQAPRAAGDLVKLYFTPPDDGAELEVLAVATWRDANTQAFRFANLSAPTYGRLRHAVERLADLC